MTRDPKRRRCACGRLYVVPSWLRYGQQFCASCRQAHYAKGARV